MSDPQRRAETLDDDKLTDPYPPDRPLALDDDPDETEDDTAARARREEPDAVPPVTPPEPGVDDLVDPQPPGGVDEEKDLVAETSPPDPDPTSDRERPAVERSAVPSAEEEAVHERGEPRDG